MKTNNESNRRQWMPLARVAEPYRTRLAAIYPSSPATHKQPEHFDLSAVDGANIWISGQVPRFDQEIRYTGIVGADISIDVAREAARLSIANFLSILSAACDGDLSKVDKIIRITGYVRCTEDFGAQATVIDAASEVLTTLFDARGRHARTAIGVRSLPGCAAVEIEGLVRLKN